MNEALRLQEEVGIDVATDGEMRRSIFFEFFVSGLDGLSPLPAGRSSSTARARGHHVRDDPVHGHREDQAPNVPRRG